MRHYALQKKKTLIRAARAISFASAMCGERVRHMA